MKKKVLYIGNFFFPNGNAAGKRVYANGKILKDLGYDVIFIGMDSKINKNICLQDTKKEYDGFEYYNFNYPKSNKEWINYKDIFNKLIEFIRSKNIIDDIEMIIFYGSPRLSLFNTKLIKFCKKNNIKILSDCVDWLTVKTSNPIFNIIKWADNTYQKAYANKKVDGIIVISTYLDKYYKKYGCKTVIIPPLSTEKVDEVLINSLENHKIITYAGLPFRKGKKIVDINTLKDRIDKTIILLSEAKKQGLKFTFNIYGFTKEEYLIAIPSQKKYIDILEDNLIFHGKQSNENIIEVVKRSDFTILIRDINRDTSAGFPTKISESISCCTPVITTNTSDLKQYIKDGENGFFLDNDNGKIEISKLISILNYNKDDILKMKNNCYYENPFIYNRYTGILKDFINNIDDKN